MKVSDLLEDLETGDRSSEHLTKNYSGDNYFHGEPLESARLNQLTQLQYNALAQQETGNMGLMNQGLQSIQYANNAARTFNPFGRNW